jgi:hypothetical protein
MAKFKIGDRVRVIDLSHLAKSPAIGDTGTVREVSNCPWIYFDQPQAFEGIPYIHSEGPNTPSIPVGPAGFCNCIGEDKLELLEEESSKFYVWNPSRHPPRCAHNSYESALQEAKRLANMQPGDNFFILSDSKTTLIIARVRAKIEVTTYY